jgi:hypothetical protein
MSPAGGAKKSKAIRLLPQFIVQADRGLAMSVQEKQADEVIMQTARSEKQLGDNSRYILR